MTEQEELLKIQENIRNFCQIRMPASIPHLRADLPKCDYCGGPIRSKTTRVTHHNGNFPPVSFCSPACHEQWCYHEQAQYG